MTIENITQIIILILTIIIFLLIRKKHKRENLEETSNVWFGDDLENGIEISDFKSKGLADGGTIADGRSTYYIKTGQDWTDLEKNKKKFTELCKADTNCIGFTLIKQKDSGYRGKLHSNDIKLISNHDEIISGKYTLSNFSIDDELKKNKFIDDHGGNSKCFGKGINDDTGYWQKQYNSIEDKYKITLGKDDVFCGKGNEWNEWIGYINKQIKETGVGYGNSDKVCDNLICGGGDTYGGGNNQIKAVLKQNKLENPIILNDYTLDVKHYCTPGSTSESSNIGGYKTENTNIFEEANKACNDNVDCKGFTLKFGEDNSYILKNEISGKSENNNFICYKKNITTKQPVTTTTTTTEQPVTTTTTEQPVTTTTTTTEQPITDGEIDTTTTDNPTTIITTTDNPTTIITTTKKPSDNLYQNRIDASNNEMEENENEINSLILLEDTMANPDNNSDNDTVDNFKNIMENFKNNMKNMENFKMENYLNQLEIQNAMKNFSKFKNNKNKKKFMKNLKIIEKKNLLIYLFTLKNKLKKRNKEIKTTKKEAERKCGIHCWFK